MALNELLIISIQTRLKGSLLIGHCKQEPLLMLHNCPLSKADSYWRCVRGLSPLGGLCSDLGVYIPIRNVCAHMGCLPCRAVHACSGLSLLRGSSCTHMGLCVDVEGCACLFEVV